MLTLVVAYQRCTGCHACSLACAVTHNHGPGQGAIRVGQLGPWRLPEGRALLENVPTCDDRCHLCAPQRREGLPPVCVAHCPTRCLRVVEGEQALARILGSDAATPHLPLMSWPRGGQARSREP